MRIEVIENDSPLHADGVPHLVIIQLTYQTGKIRLLPYPTDRTIQQMLMDFEPLNDGGGVKVVDHTKPVQLVQCRRDIDADLIAGRRYRVLSPIKDNGTLAGYEVIDDEADVPRRLSVALADVEEMG